ncbi:MAG: YncE family protein [Bacteroidetes bacterium]|jgi:YVTN family beta-propeller protein|nr:YncE family protein [Bacteroidota bacterium]MBT6685467.1 YncE family protein [Bacteroidota bacterium]MBT7144394.1 YncE family protein [Bacteroidota bacterium]MBT7490536.1 YncE family protein [Bacteroidota bacterium]
MKTNNFFLFGLFSIFILISSCSEEPLNPTSVEDIQFNPIIQITSPKTGSDFAYGDTIKFSGKILDIIDRNDYLNVQWHSDKDGVIDSAQAAYSGMLSFETNQLSQNEHIISLIITNSNGNITKDSIIIYYNKPQSITLYDIGRDYNSFNLSWSKSTASDFTSYKLYRSLYSGMGTDGDLIATIEAIDDTTYQDIENLFGYTNYYQVFVFNNSGQSNSSNELDNVSGFVTNLDLNIQIGTFLSDDNNKYLFVSDKENDEIVVINIESGIVENNISVGNEPHGIAINSNKNELYVANSYEYNISVIDILTMTMVREINTTTYPYNLSYSNITNKLYATTKSSHYPRIIDVENYEEIGLITAASGIMAYSLCEASKTDSFLYIGEVGSTPASLYKFNISTDSPVLAVENDYGSIGSYILDMKLSFDASSIFIACEDPYYVQVLNTNDFNSVGTLYTAYPTAIAISPDGSTAFVANSSKWVYVFDIDTYQEISRFYFSNDIDIQSIKLSVNGVWLFVIVGDYGNYGSQRRDLVILKLLEENK